MRSPRNAVKSSPRSLQLEKARMQQQRPNSTINKQINKLFKKKCTKCFSLLHNFISKADIFILIVLILYGDVTNAPEPSRIKQQQIHFASAFCASLPSVLGRDSSAQLHSAWAVVAQTWELESPGGLLTCPLVWCPGREDSNWGLGQLGLLHLSHVVSY